MIGVRTAVQEVVIVRELSQLECGALKNKQSGGDADTLAF